MFLCVTRGEGLEKKLTLFRDLKFPSSPIVIDGEIRGRRGGKELPNF